MNGPYLPLWLIGVPLILAIIDRIMLPKARDSLQSRPLGRPL